MMTKGQKQSKIGLALSGGGARGFAHIGVLKVLEQAGIPIAAVSGTSAGSFVGAAVAAGLSAAHIEELARRLSWKTVLRPALSPLALFSAAPMKNFIAREFGVSDFDQLKLPFAAVAFDVKMSKQVVLTSGDLAEAIQASCAVPGVFVPLRRNGMMLVDGGVTSPLPVKQALELGSDAVIAVDLLSSGTAFDKTPKTGLGILLRSGLMMIQHSARNQHYRAKIVIEPRIAHIRPDQINKGDELIRLGEAAAHEKLDDILRLIDQNSDI